MIQYRFIGELNRSQCVSPSVPVPVMSGELFVAFSTTFWTDFGLFDGRGALLFSFSGSVELLFKSSKVI